MDKPGIETADSRWKSLYTAGGAAPLIMLAFYLTEVVVMIFALEPYPSTPYDWLSLFQRNKILGLLYLNALDILSIALLGLMFLALYVALRQVNESYMAIAAFFAFIGIPVFIVPRVASLSVLPLSEQYAAAITDAQRSQILAAGQAVSAQVQATPQTAGFFFMTVAVLIISVVMLRSAIFNDATAYVGILASVFTFALDISTVIAPSQYDVLMGVVMLLWVAWYISISRRLLRLGRGVSREEANRG